MSSGSNPFEGMPFFGDLLKMLGSQGPVQWDGARQLAFSIATDGGAESNVDPLERMAYDQLARVAELQVANATGLDTSSSGKLTITPVTRGAWVDATLDAYKPLIERLAAAIGSGASGTQLTSMDLDDGADPTEAWFGQIMGLLSPMLLGMTAGSMIGHLATRTFGLYDLPIPRPDRDEILIVAANVQAFGDDWSMNADDLRLWVCLHQVTHHAILRLPHVRARLDQLLGDYMSAFENDPAALEDKIGELESSAPSGDPMAQFQELLGNPEFVLGAVRSARQEAILPELVAIISVISAYVDAVMDRIGHGLIGSYGQVTEALRRRRVESSDSDRFVERLLGLELTQAHYDRGRAFVDGVVERAGTEGLDHLWSADGNLPTPNEVDAPGLWLARIGVDTFDSSIDIDLSGLDELLGGPDADGDNT